MEAKMNYIKAWQSLPEFGISLFVVKFMGHKKEELLGIAYNRLMRMDITTGDHIKTWRYNTMKVRKKKLPLIPSIPIPFIYLLDYLVVISTCSKSSQSHLSLSLSISRIFL